ncbi:MAG: STAS domain-containing protein [Roseovarius sp.]|nr:STAS domain-containing protein [Roseovarius sp.]
MTRIYKLPPRLDYEATGTLHESLLASRGEAITLDAGAVTHLGGLALQLLVAAREQWRRDGLALRIEPRSRNFSEDVAMLGMVEDFFSEEAAQ